MKHQAEPYSKKTYDPILSGSKEWPVVQLSKNRKAFVEEVIEETIKVIKAKKPDYESLKEEIERTRFREKIRVEQNPWNVDPDDDYKFWSKVKKSLVHLSPEANEKNEKIINDLLREIVTRYVNEIASNFKPTRHRMARAIIKFGFRRLLNASQDGFTALWKGDLTLQDKIEIKGEDEHLRKLAQIGTVVMVPTHFSNLDSILLGWIIHVMGLPPFIYGAGLNLFNINILAYFMNSLGAYKVDRRKKSLIYIESLKSYSKLAIVKGCHSLFFPGGTRSRSGNIEKHLKLGLLGSATEAQRYILQNKIKDKKIFVVPVVLNYNFVLEAPELISGYLQRKGMERYYVESDRFSTSYNIMKFLFKFFTKGSNISVSIGRGLDLFGNQVDNEGNSIDKSGNVIDISDYFESGGNINEDTQREKEYTRMLGDVIVKEFHRINIVFSSHLVAFAAFQYFKKKYKKLDLYDLLRLPKEERIIPYSEFKEIFDKLRNQVLVLNKEGTVGIANHLPGELEEVIKLGLNNVGMYHAKRPLLLNKNGDIVSENLSTLYYYHNRLVGYELENYV